MTAETQWRGEVTPNRSREHIRGLPVHQRGDIFLRFAAVLSASWSWLSLVFNSDGWLLFVAGCAAALVLGLTAGLLATVTRPASGGRLSRIAQRAMLSVGTVLVIVDDPVWPKVLGTVLIALGLLTFCLVDRTYARAWHELRHRPGYDGRHRR